MASVGFGGEAKVWDFRDGSWNLEGQADGKFIVSTSIFCVLLTYIPEGNKAGEIWAIALSEDGQYLASTTVDGRINVWDCFSDRKKIREFETKGSFGLAIDLVCQLQSPTVTAKYTK